MCNQKDYLEHPFILRSSSKQSLKSSMVYPEKSALNQMNKNKICPSPSWCDEPLENHSNNINIAHYEKKINGNYISSEDIAAVNNLEDDYPNRVFIQDRIRHLVEAFSSRTRAVKERIETPGTPSSLSSAEFSNETSFAIGSPSHVQTPQRKCINSNEASEEKIMSNSLRNNLRNYFVTCTVDPNGKLYLGWMFFVTVTFLYNAWVIPLRSTFPYQTPENRIIWMVFDYLTDFVYLIDMIVIQPKVKYLEDGFWVIDVSLLRNNYLKRRQFKLDLVSLLPLDVFYFIFGPDFVVLRLPRLLKVHSFWKLVSFIDKLVKNPYVVRISKTLMYMMYLIHLNACAYYAFSTWEGIGNNSFVFNGKGNAYIKCFYFATKTATSIGKNPKPTHEIEYMFMTVSWLMGVFVFAVLIGQIRDIISTANRNRTEYNKLVNETLEYMRRLNLPIEMQRRAQQWFTYTWKTQRTLDESTIMDCLPHKMKTDIAINVHIQTLSKVKLFADCDEALLRELVLQLKSVIYLPGDIICRKGDVGKEMYIIQSGKVQVIGTNSEVLATLSEGSVFGEISLLGIPGKNRRTADVRSQGHSNLFVLSKADLNAALSQYPEAQELLNKKAKLLMKKNAALERKQNAMIVIDNPIPPLKQAKLVDTVLQVLPFDSNTNRLLRFGSRAYSKSKPENDKFKFRNSMPHIESLASLGDVDRAVEAKVTVHRTSS
ncbi:cyclic nucleotide-gated cation channel beta-1 isoform X2 [Harmonia axyridis]|uniref:cyclic nucleotide-gated cation channel beta-1 isoform X2 n=1 Tax=Harmonia axyridis TaxID=115357 RepID=UPI001E277D39|nr:cyclic nucleotide-gated cation channel beta-1 isoform X2 [Harmonia axyridis]